jgi:hypothetical protein
MRKGMNNGLQELDLTPYRPDGGVRGKLKYAIGKALGRIQLTGFERIGEIGRAWNAAFRNF